MQDKFRDTFKLEALELLSTLEGTILDLESDPGDAESISSVFRVMHTIKGSGAMFGFLHISRFTHEIEDLMDMVRQGQKAVNQDLIDILLVSRDHIRDMLDEADPPPSELLEASEKILQKVRQAGGGSTNDSPVSQSGASQVHASTTQSSLSGANQITESGFTSTEMLTYRIRLVPDNDFFRNGSNPLALLRELRELGDCTCIPYTHNVPDLIDIEPESSYFYWDIILTSCAEIHQIEDVFLFVRDRCALKIDSIDELSMDDLEPSKRLGQILLERGVVKPEQVSAALDKQMRIGQVLQDEGVNAFDIEAALEEQEHIKRSRKRLLDDPSRQGVRVASEKLDDLIDLVGELVTLQARVSSTAHELDHATMSNLAENLQHLTDELRESTLSIRMLPISGVFSKFRRLVRDLGQKLGKNIELETRGEDTELDKTILDKLTDPLMHLIRNAVDHGIEYPAERTAAGKPSCGTILVKAEQFGANILISIEDDGRGLNRDAILEKAIARNLISDTSSLNDKDILDLISMPGFSTVSEVTEVSGRGVGMDVVKQQIDALNGTLEVYDSERGGTCFVLVLPLTLAIIDGLLIKTGTEYYVIPLSVVEECIEWSPDSGKSSESGMGREVLTIQNRGKMISSILLRNYFSIDEQWPDIHQAIVVNHRNEKIGIIADQVIGSHQTVIKPLGRLYKDIPGISGATILGDGSVALILDIQRLSSEVAQSEREKINA
ncbi:chemotaxis protein CheA [Spirochaeta dissipatitropha]